ncbi:MAG: hypothetical protein M1827_005577 [Pycnora praestabilis]|nr:MAG: hypothetical protein M1827_005577 [Pycnora praestabilis]
MDPLSIAFAVAPLVGSATKIAKTLYDLYGKYKGVSGTLGSLAAECMTLSAGLSQIQNLALSNPDSLSSRREDKSRLLTVIDNALTGCSMVLRVLDDKVGKLAGKEHDSLSFKDKLQILFNEDTIKEFLDQVRGQQIALNLLLTALQMLVPLEIGWFLRYGHHSVMLIQYRESMSQVRELLVNQGIVLQKVAERARSLRAPYSKGEPSVLGTAGYDDSIYSIGQDSVATSTEFSFDEEIVSAGAYRRALAAQERKLREVESRSRSRSRSIETRNTDAENENTPTSSMLAVDNPFRPRSAGATPSGAHLAIPPSHHATTSSQPTLPTIQQASIKSVPNEEGRSISSVLSIQSDRYTNSMNTGPASSSPSMPVTLPLEMRIQALNVKESTPQPSASRTADVTGGEESSGDEGSDSYVGWTTWHTTIEEGDIDTMKKWIQEGVELETTDEELRTPLHIAGLNGNTAIAEMLLGQSAHLEMLDENSCTPLHLACWKGHAETSTLLLAHGANIEARDEDFCTPLHLAVQGGDRQTIEMLIEHKADLEAVSKNGHTHLHWAARKRQNLNCRAPTGSFREHRSTNKTPIYTPHLRLDLWPHLYPDIKAADTDLYTSLHWAALGGYTTTVQTLLDHGVQTDMGDLYACTSLFRAAEAGHTDTAALLLSYGVNIESPSKDGFHPLHLAAQKGHADTVDLLLTKGAAINPRDNHANTPLILASYNGQVSAVSTLLRRGALPECEDDGGWRALHRAAHLHQPKIVDQLLEHGAYIWAKTTDGEYCSGLVLKEVENEDVLVWRSKEEGDKAKVLRLLEKARRRNPRDGTVPPDPKDAYDEKDK